MDNLIKTKHGLDFEVATWYANPIIKLFRVGTVDGQYYHTQTHLVLLSIVNNQPGNGHFNDALSWFLYVANFMQKSFKVEHVMNDRFAKYLERNGYKKTGDSYVLKPRELSKKVKNLIKSGEIVDHSSQLSNDFKTLGLS